MIIVRITSGLGNQMFQYALYSLLKQKYKDTEILCDTYWFNCNHEHREYELERVFSGVDGSLFEIKKAPLSDIIKLSGKVPNLFSGSLGKVFEKIRRYPNRLLKNTLLKKRTPYIIDELSYENQDELLGRLMSLDTSVDYYIMGYYISELFYSGIYEEVKKHFVFPEFTEDYNISYKNEIVSCDSVSIHVRRGDYLSDLYKDSFLTLGKEYYEEAVKYVTDKVKESCALEGRDCKLKFFIFSDDADFVKKEFYWLSDKAIITENTGDKSFRDMQLMSLCKHNIIANSTFSQWGALLNSNPNHITVYPKIYMRNQDNEIKSGWKRI